MPDQNEYLRLVDSQVPSAKPEEENPYLSIIDNGMQQRLRQSVAATAGLNPDTEAKLKGLADYVGLPVDAVRLDPTEAERRARIESIDYNTVVQKTPATASFLSDPQRAAVAHDDIENLSTLEETLGFLRNSGKALLSSLPQFNAGLWGVAQAATESFVQPLTRPLAGTVLPEDIGARMAAKFGQYRQEQKDFANSLMPQSSGNVESGFYSGLQSFGQNLLTLPAAVLTGNPALVLGPMTASVGGDAYGQARAAGLSVPESIAFGGSQAIVEYATEKLPLGRLLGDLKAGTPFFKTLARNIALEVPQEQAATVLQDMNEWAALNPEKPFSAYLTERPSAAAQTLVATLVSTGGQVTVTTGVQKAVNRISGETARAQQAEQDAKAMAALNDLAAQSKLRQRDPAAFEAFVQQAMEEGPIDNVYLDPKTLSQSGIDIAALAQASPSIAAQVTQAAATGEDIRIPIEEFAAKIAGTEFAQGLIPHLRTSPGGMSQLEAQTYMQSQATELQAEVEKVLTEQTQNEAFKASRETVIADLTAKLDETGRFSTDVNRAYATLLGNFFAVQGAKIGLSPQEMAQRYQLDARAQRPGGAMQLDQLATPSTIQMPDVPTVEQMQAHSRVEVVPLAKAASFQTARRWDEFNNGKHPGDAVEGYGDKPVAVRLETGEYVILDGNHRTDLAIKSGATALEMYVIDAKSYDPQHAGRKPVELDSDALLRDLFGDTLNQSATALPETLDIDGVARPTTNSKGQPIAQTEEGVRNFWNWFADSKVIDDQGRPLVVYHGTTARAINEFRPAGGVDGEWQKALSHFKEAQENNKRYGYMNFRSGTFFSPKPEYAGNYTNENKGIIYPAYIRAENPVYFDQAKKNAASGIDLNKTPDALILYDGEISDINEIAVIDPTQIKSATGNDGTFDANDPSILSQTQRGSITIPDQGVAGAPSIVTLLEKADLSTFLHESGHFFLEVMNDMAMRADAPEGIRQDMDAVLKWFGVPDLAAWNAMPFEEKVQHHEQFARGFEAYLFEGKSPNVELNGLFSKFRAWLINVYRSLAQLDVTLSDEVRSVFDRMLASSEAIAEAEAVRKYGALFEQKPDVMGDQEWQDYRDQAVQAAQDAAHTLETRSLSNMQWLRNARSRVLRRMQQAAAGKRKEVRAQVEAEVMAEPIYRARLFITHGEFSPANLNNAQRRVLEDASMRSTKLSLSTLKAMYGEGPTAQWRYLPTGKYGMAGDEGMHPDMLAELFGIKSGDELVRGLIAAERPAEKIEGITDQRMLERYGDMMDTPSLEKAVDEALHNEMRMKMVAADLNALNRMLGNKQILAKAAKAFAEQTVAKRMVGALRPNEYSAAAARAAKASDVAFKKGDIQTAAREKQNQLINGYAAKAAYEAQDDMRRIGERFRKIVRGKDADVAKTRDMDMVQAVRATLAEYGIGQRGKKAASYIEAVKAYDPSMYEFLRDQVDAMTEDAKPFAQLTVAEMRTLRDQVESMWALAKRSRQVVIDGELIDRKEVEERLKARIDEIGVPDVVPGEGRAFTERDQRIAQLRGYVAAVRRVESWTQAKDGGFGGPFRQYVFTPIKEAADAYRSDKAKYLKRYQELLDAIAPTLAPGKIDAPELGYVFGYDKGGMGKAELLHAILHTGNESNKKKMLLGRKWATEREDGSLDTRMWDGFINRLIREGRITKLDFDFAQGVWDMLEELKPMAQKAHRDVFGRYFDEVTADQVVTPFGTYRGGYVPAIADYRIVADAKTRAMAEAENNSLMYAFPTTNKGFTRSRVEYNRPLLLDLRSIAQHIDKVLMFSRMERPVRDVRRVMSSNTVSYGLNRLDPSAYDGLLTPWLNRAARQQVETPIVGDNGLMRFFSAIRARAGMAAMFLNVSNAIQQISGVGLAAVRVKPTRLMSSLAGYIIDPKGVSQAVAEASPYMSQRMDDQIAVMTNSINEILLNPTTYEKVKTWSARHAYFLQTAVDNVLSPIIWTAAYNQGIEEAPADLTDKERETYARRFADSTVRETQGSNLPEDIARIESANAFARIFTQFSGYFNGWSNLLGTEMKIAIQEAGLKNGMGRAAYVLFVGFLSVAWTAEAITLAFRGGPDDEDEDGTIIDDWLASIFGWGTLRNATALFPVVGQGINSVVNAFNDKPYDDRLATSPAISMLETTARAPFTVYKALEGEKEPSRAVKDVATLLSMTIGVPVSAAARPVSYIAGMASGEVDPTSPVDLGRGLATGVASPDSKR